MILEIIKEIGPRISFDGGERKGKSRRRETGDAAQRLIKTRKGRRAMPIFTCKKCTEEHEPKPKVRKKMEKKTGNLGGYAWEGKLR